MIASLFEMFIFVLLFKLVFICEAEFALHVYINQKFSKVITTITKGYCQILLTLNNIIAKYYHSNINVHFSST